MTEICRFVLIKEIYLNFKKLKRTPPVGLEPTTLELEVQHASPLRLGGLFALSRRIIIISKILHLGHYHFL